MHSLDLGWFLTLHPDTPSCKRYRDSIGYLLGKASLFITGAVLRRMKMVLGKGLESNQRGHCCVVGGERSDIWIGDGGGEEKGLFAQPAAEDMVVISQAHISFCCHFGSKIWPELKVFLDNKPSLHGIPNFETVECHNFYPTESRNILQCLSDPRHGPTLF